jgi:hypothetical protein
MLEQTRISRAIPRRNPAQQLATSIKDQETKNLQIAKKLTKQNHGTPTQRLRRHLPSLPTRLSTGSVEKVYPLAGTTRALDQPRLA